MANYVIELYLGAGRERFFLTSSDCTHGVTPQQRNAKHFACLSDAVLTQNEVYALSTKDMLKLIRKPKDYTVPVMITIQAVKETGAARSRCQRTYLFKPQE